MSTRTAAFSGVIALPSVSDINAADKRNGRWSVATNMEPSRVLHKTAQGEQELRGAARSLSQKMRSVLIVVNGERSVAQLARMLPALPVPETLRALEAGGHVTAGAAISSQDDARATAPGDAIVVAGAAAVAPQNAAGAASSWVEALRAVAVAQIETLAGTGGAVIVQRLGRVRRPGELRIEIERAAHHLERFVDPAAARRFSDAMAAHLRGAVRDGTSPPAVKRSSPSALASGSTVAAATGSPAT